MMIPDDALMAENILFSEGFEKDNALTRKCFSSINYPANSSPSKTYDFGMRAIKSVLAMAGALRRQYPNLTEDVVLIRAMRNSSILSQDLPFFMGIIQGLLPGVNIPNADCGELNKQIKQSSISNASRSLIKHYFVSLWTVASSGGKTPCPRVVQHEIEP